MATKANYELIQYDGRNAKYKGKLVRQYEDGTIKDERGYWVERPANGAALISTDTALSYVLAREEKKRAVAAAAANEAVENGTMKQYGDLAYVAELVAAAQRKGTNIDDPKMIEAARFVMQTTGFVEREQVQQAPTAPDPELIDAIAGLMDKIRLLRDS